MKREQFKFINILKILLIVTCIIVGCFIGFYPFPRQNLTMKIYTDKGKVSVPVNKDEIRDLLELDEKGNPIPVDDENQANYFVDWTTIGATELKEIDICRKYDSIIIAKINADAMWMYGTFDSNGITLNQQGIEMLYGYTRSFLVERMIYEEILIAGVIFLWILVNALKEKMQPDNRDNHGPIYEINQFLRNILKYRQYMWYAAKADLKAEVANSYLNRLWWVLEPFCNMLVYVVVFGKVMGNNIEKYATFIFSALLMWNFFSHIINYSVKCVRNNRDIVTKIYVPKYVLLLTNMILNFIKLLFSMMVLVVMLGIFKVHINWTVLYLIPAYLLMFILSFGIGMIFVHYGVFIDDLSYAVGILLNLLMFLSGMFYDVVNTLPEPLNFVLMCLNPVVVFIDAMRNALLYNKITNVPILIVWMLLGVLISYIGIHIVNKNENGYVKVI
mgnify:CR=1 FL=1